MSDPIIIAALFESPDEPVEAGFGTEAGYLAAHTAAVEAINAAIAGGGKGEKIGEAGEKLAEAERKAAKHEWAEATKKAGEALHEAQEALHDRGDD